VEFRETGHKYNMVEITGKIIFAAGVLDGKHGFHVHEGDADSGCDATGSHFNPSIYGSDTVSKQTLKETD
jgi:Cu/Zn superoxide dismutase